MSPRPGGGGPDVNMTGNFCYLFLFMATVNSAGMLSGYNVGYQN